MPSAAGLPASEVQIMGVTIRSVAVKRERPAQPLLAFVPALAVMSWPFWLRGAHAVAESARMLMLLGALAMPLLAAAWWLGLAPRSPRSVFERRARQLALLAFAAPPLFVSLSFVLRVLEKPLPEPVAWVGLWAAVAAWLGVADSKAPAGMGRPPDATARVVHGVIAALVLAFIAFHLVNHLAGLLGPQVHASVMHLGRSLYRSPAVEAVLVVLLLLQVAFGAGLAWRWSARAMDGYRAVQVATGVYAGFFLLTHLNSALVSARLLNGVDTDWAWASGAPVGLLHDA